MSDNFKNRPRFSLQECQNYVKKAYGAIFHIVANDDKTHSVMSHINCEHCDYCDEDNEWYDKQEAQGLTYEEIIKLDKCIHLAKEDPYQEQKKKFPENYGL